MSKPTTLDSFMNQRDEEWRRDAKHVCLMTVTAYEKNCLQCDKMIKVEDEGRGTLRICVFCEADGCVRKRTR
ncbi:MAG: hypothetical protein QXT26_08495 [Thermoproteota archaeon]